jgi:hypothetical protein
MGQNEIPECRRGAAFNVSSQYIIKVHPRAKHVHLKLSWH